MSQPGDTYGSRLLPQHQQLLEASGIKVDVASERGYVSADTKALLEKRGFAPSQQRPPALIIPLFNVEGDRGGSQCRPDDPRLDEQGRPIKYETPAGATQVLDVHPWSVPHLGDPTTALVITEGTRKADAAVSRAMVAIGLNGVWGWKGPNRHGGSVPLPDWERVALNGREVLLVFDSDVTTKPQVRKALERLEVFLQGRDAVVRTVLLPEVTPGVKVGLDDYLAANARRGLPDLRALPTVDPGSAQRRVLTRSQLSTLPPVRHRIKNTVSQPASVVVVGETGVGKTATVLGMALSVAIGRPWMAQEVDTCPVLWVVGEAPNGLDKRVRAWEEKFNDGKPVPDDRFHILVKPPSLLAAGEWEKLTADVVTMGAGVVVLDTLSTLFPDADETRDAARIIRLMSDLADATGATVILIHHSGWGDKGRARGGSQLESNADEVLILRQESLASSTFSVLFKKFKDDESGQVIWLQREVVAGAVVVTAGRAIDAELPVDDRIVTLLAAGGKVPTSGAQLTKEMPDVDRSTIYRRLRSLEARHRIVNIGTERRPTFLVVEMAP